MWWWWHALQHWLAVHTGSSNTPGAPPNYNFWSGSGSDIGEVTILGGLLAIYKRHNCHTRWCWRFGRHDFTDDATGLTYRLCRHCHPEHPGRQLHRARIAVIHERNQQGGGDEQEG